MLLFPCCFVSLFTLSDTRPSVRWSSNVCLPLFCKMFLFYRYHLTVGNDILFLSTPRQYCSVLFVSTFGILYCLVVLFISSGPFRVRETTVNFLSISIEQYGMHRYLSRGCSIVCEFIKTWAVKEK